MPRSSSTCISNSTTILIVSVLVCLLVAHSFAASFTKKKDKDKDLSNASSKILGKSLSIPVIQAASNSGYTTGSTEARKQSAHSALAFVTPWNNKGYDFAKRFISKFTHISPVWISMEPTGKLSGLHDIDQGWISDVRAAADANRVKVKIVPRVYFGGWPGEAYRAFERPEVIETFSEVLLHICSQNRFDGIVLDFALGPSAAQHVIPLLSSVYPIMRKANFELLVVLPPIKIHDVSFYTQQELHQIIHASDLVQVTTYDYSMPTGRSGPISPYDWLVENIFAMIPEEMRGEEHKELRQKLLIGLNFYGMHYPVASKPEPVRGSEILDILQQNAKGSFEWDETTKEHTYVYSNRGKKGVVHLPTPLSVSSRVALANEYSLGIAFWEIGQAWESLFRVL